MNDQDSPRPRTSRGSRADAQGSAPSRGAVRTPASGRTVGSAPRPRLANTRRRARVLFVTTLFVLCVFAAQLIRLQGFEASAIAQSGRLERTGSTRLPAVRGAITDANGVVLAQSEDRYTVTSCPRDVREYERTNPDTELPTGGKVGAEGAAEDLAPVLGMAKSELLPLLTGAPDECYKVLKKGLKPLEWRQVANLKIPGINYDPTDGRTERTYPGGAAAAPLIGWVGPNGEAKGKSGGGLEWLLNDNLKGSDGRLTAEYSVTGQVIPMAEREITHAVSGKTVKLTIDNDLQWYASNAIAAAVQKNKAQWGVVVVMDRSGRIRSAAQYPSFNPSKIATGDITWSLPFTTPFEPGSTAKVMSIGAALDQGLTIPQEQWTIPSALPRPQVGFTIHDMHVQSNPYLTTTGIMAVSSNIGTSMIGERMKPETLYDYQRKFGLGAASATNFPGESEGIIAAPGEMSGSQRYTVMYGQGIAATAIQAAGVFQTVANGGVRVPPTLVAGTTDAEGTFTPAPEPPHTRVLREESNATLLRMMENVTTEGGTAVGAEIPGYRVAGKTGTADIAENGRYNGKNTLSFIGIAPADDPELICAVILQAPNSNASAIVAPIFKSVMTYGLAKFQIPPTGKSLDPFPNHWGATAPHTKTR